MMKTACLPKSFYLLLRQTHHALWCRQRNGIVIIVTAPVRASTLPSTTAPVFIVMEP